MTNQRVTIRRSPDRNIVTIRTGRDEVVHDLSSYFTIAARTQGVRADRAGEFHRAVVNPVKDWMFGP